MNVITTDGAWDATLDARAIWNGLLKDPQARFLEGQPARRSAAVTDGIRLGLLAVGEDGRIAAVKNPVAPKPTEKIEPKPTVDLPRISTGVSATLPGLEDVIQQSAGAEWSPPAGARARFTKLHDPEGSSIMDERPMTRLLWLQTILTKADERGFLRFTNSGALARMANIPEADVISALRDLAKTDQESGCKAFGGARIVLVTDGLFVPSISRYRTYRTPSQIKDAERKAVGREADAARRERDAARKRQERAAGKSADVRTVSEDVHRHPHRVHSEATHNAVSETGLREGLDMSRNPPKRGEKRRTTELTSKEPASTERAPTEPAATAPAPSYRLPRSRAADAREAMTDQSKGKR
jgi:hypothetical protein